MCILVLFQADAIYPADTWQPDLYVQGDDNVHQSPAADRLMWPDSGIQKE